MRRFDDEDITGAEFRECDLSRTRMVGVVMQDAEIDGLVTNLVANGVEVMGVGRGGAGPPSPGTAADPVGCPGRAP
jgi:hypothetical protein